MGSDQRKYVYEAVPGFFAQELPDTDPITFDYVCIQIASENRRRRLIECSRRTISGSSIKPTKLTE